ncbi:helix-turn-helix transcriptional regulator [Parahaliea mediterranea]|uniref:helix-turn-helix transcriptional regulator n=1 Tax=Parahaliea mediterranea TaxID=651086 RepID=UPI0013006484|nr:helix-turn-helix domain-containing protein [Parahaliea mediterranea]
MQADHNPVLKTSIASRGGEDALLTTQEVADLLGVTRRNVNQRIQRGEIKGVKLSTRTTRIALSEYRRYVASLPTA